MLRNKTIQRSIAIGSTTLLLNGVVPRKTEANPAVFLPPAVSACLASVVCALGVAVVGGGAVVWVIYQNGQQQQVPVSPMIDDPEAPREEWSHEVWARSEAEARSKCRALAEGWTRKGQGAIVRLNNVKLKRRGQNSNLYTCTFETEG